LTCEICVVAPIYNEEGNVLEYVKRTTKVLESISDRYEIILVNDGSRDKSWQIIEEITENNEKIKALNFSKNFGHHYAISAGLKHANANWVVVMDSDLQDRPEVIKDLYDKANEGFDIVFVDRTNRPESKPYIALQRIFYIILKLLSGLNFNYKQANFSIISSKVVESFNAISENTRFYVSTIKWLGFESTSISANHGRRFSGKPSYSISKRFKLAFDIITSFSERPLKIGIVIGLGFSALSLSIFLWIILKYLTTGFSVLGWPSLIASILLLNGITLTVLGIIGVYIGKIYNETKSRPLYIIKNKINF